MLQFKYELKLTFTEKVFRKHMGPGVAIEQIVTFNDANEGDQEDVFFIKALLDQEYEFVKENVEVIVTPMSEQEGVAWEQRLVGAPTLQEQMSDIADALEGLEVDEAFRDTMDWMCIEDAMIVLRDPEIAAQEAEETRE
ncbi:MAG: hypothetical protein V3R81_01285 [Gammaproteobacteria bacterium]